MILVDFEHDLTCLGTKMLSYSLAQCSIFIPPKNMYTEVATKGHVKNKHIKTRT